MSFSNLLDTAWSRPTKVFALQPRLLSQSATDSEDNTSSSSDYTQRSSSGSPYAKDVKYAMDFKPKLALRKVYNVAPLTSLSDADCLLFNKASEVAPLAVQPSFYGLKIRLLEENKAANYALPIPIPGASDFDALERKSSLIKAVPAGVKKASPESQAIPFAIPQAKDFSAKPQHVTTPKESWTSRQKHFPVDEQNNQPPGLGRALKARNAMAKARAHQSSNSAAKPLTAEELAWRFRFKKKWIREELYARRQNFPDDPGYEDEWEDAHNLVEALGPEGALQAAFLQSKFSSSQAESEDLELEETEVFQFDTEEILNEQSLSSDDGISRSHSSHSSSASSQVAAKAAKLVRLERKGRKAVGVQALESYKFGTNLLAHI